MPCMCRAQVSLSLKLFQQLDSRLPPEVAVPDHYDWEGDFWQQKAEALQRQRLMSMQMSCLCSADASWNGSDLM